ncbi:DUF3293 domain-containing protein [Deinococcus navajonensis]|uniref:DUF3293 domain-containing protein n=1 Tax=Deinococcus navajonensis TaxID=309884 RepID=A0ABV8XK29_9DEIO
MSLRCAFLDTTYGTGHERFRLSPTPPGAHQRLSWMTPGQRWALITAWNPAGERQRGPWNHVAQARLQTAAGAWPQRPALNGSGKWAEPALLLLGLPATEALRLGREFRQAAVVWGTGRRGALVWIRPEGAHAERFWAVPVAPT